MGQADPRRRPQSPIAYSQRTERVRSKLTPDERRAVVMAALEHNANISEIARRYSIRRQRVYQLLEDAMLDPRERLREAEREVAFRRRVKELVG
jgi:transposase-like protein